MRIISKTSILALTALSLTACSEANTNSTTNTSRINSNTAVVVNSNSAMNSNMTMNSSSTNSTVNSNTGGSKNVSSADADFMNKAAQSGMAEVELGKMASQKAQNAEVKQFAQQMIAEHTRANNELKTLAAGKSFTLPTDVNAEHKEAMDKLSKLSGAAFDKEYVAVMIKDHEKSVAEFQKQSDGGTDADVKAFAAKTLPVIKMHTEMVKGINAKMK